MNQPFGFCGFPMRRYTDLILMPPPQSSSSLGVCRTHHTGQRARSGRGNGAPDAGIDKPCRIWVENARPKDRENFWWSRGTRVENVAGVDSAVSPRANHWCSCGFRSDEAIRSWEWIASDGPSVWNDASHLLEDLWWEKNISNINRISFCQLTFLCFICWFTGLFCAFLQGREEQASCSGHMRQWLTRAQSALKSTWHGIPQNLGKA